METARHLQTSLASQSIPTPSLRWLHELVTSRPQPAPPLASLLATARARLLAADLAGAAGQMLDEGWAAAHCLPAGAVPAAAGAGAGPPPAREARLGRDVVVQVLDVEDVARSRWEQVEEMEAVARGEGTRGREVVRLPVSAEDGEGEGDEGTAVGNNQAAAAAAAKKATHKLVLQDCRGQKVYAIELKRVEHIAVGRTFIGEKMLLRAGTKVARGVVLLEPEQCVMLGGKVEAWHRAWVEGRLARLKEAVGAAERR